MDARLNRADAAKRSSLIAVICGAAAAAPLSMGPSDLLAGQPARLPAPVQQLASRENTPAENLFIREPVDESVTAKPWAISQKSESDSTRTRVANQTASFTSSRLPSSAPSRPITRTQSLSSLDSALFTTLRTETAPTVFPGFSTQSLRQTAAKSLDDAADRLNYRASLSAGASASEALRLVAQSIDIQRGNDQATTEVMAALTTIREAEDFVGRYGVVDSAAIARMVRSHETQALKDFDTSQLTGIVAADIYLDSARQRLAAVAVADPLAVRAIQFLSKAYRQRASESEIALPTSVHLMRAATQVASGDRELAYEFAAILQQAQLNRESQEVLATLSRMPAPSANRMGEATPGVIAIVSGTQTTGGLEPTQHAIQIQQLSPDAFAAISRPEAGPSGSAGNIGSLSDAGAGQKSTSDTHRQTDSASPPKRGDAMPTQGNAVSRAFKAMTRAWH